MLNSINRNVKFYLLSDSFYYSGYSVINAFLSLLVTSKITGGRLDLVGYVLSYYMLVRASTAVPLSKISNRLSPRAKRNAVGTAYIFYGITIFLLGQSTLLWHVFLFQTVVGLIDAFAYPIKWSIFTRIIDKDKEEMEWGLEDIFSTLLPAFFTVLAGYVSKVGGIEMAFALFSILLVSSGVAFFSIRLIPDKNDIRSFHLEKNKY